MSIQETTVATIFQRSDKISEIYVPSHQVGIDELGSIVEINKIAAGVFLVSFAIDLDIVKRLSQLKTKTTWESCDTAFVQKFLDKFFPLRSIPDVEKEIAKHFDPSCTLVNSAVEGHIGRSGDRIYFVKNTDQKIIATAKALITHRRDIQYETQLRGITELSKLPIEGLTPIKCLSSSRGDKFHLLILSPAVGEVQEQLFKHLDKDPAILPKLKDTFHKIGIVYARLHAYQQTPVKEIPANESKEYFDIWNDCKKVLESNPLFADFDVKAMDDHLHQLYRNFCSNPGYNCYTHGDPHPGNWFYDQFSNQVTLIDLGHFSALGHPANELHSVHSCLAYHSFIYGIDREKAKALQESFSAGYLSHYHRDYATHESQVYYHSFWGMMSMRDRLLKDPVKYEEYIRNMLTAIQTKNTLHKY